MLIVDSQIHLWHGSGAPPHHRSEPYSAEEAIETMDRAGVARAVNCPAIWDDTANDYAVEAAAAHPDRLATMGWFSLDRRPDPDFVESFLARTGMLGLRFVVVRSEDCAALANGELDWIWDVAERLRRPVAFGIQKPLLETVAAVAARFPDARFLLDHLGVGAFEKLPAAIDHLNRLEALASVPNLALKASATPSMSNLSYPFMDVSEPLRRLFDAYGPDRLFWGTDLTRMHVSLSQCVTQFTENLPWLSGRELERVMGAGLLDWLGWTVG